MAKSDRADSFEKIVFAMHEFEPAVSTTHDSSRVAEATIGPIFHQPWWLEAAAPGRWGEVVVTSDGKVVARLPYVERRSPIGEIILGSAPMTKYLGPSFDLKSEKIETRLSKEVEMFEALHTALPRYSWFSQNWHFDQQNWYSAVRKGLKADPHMTYIIDSVASEKDLWSGLNERIRRNVRKAIKQVELVTDGDVEAVNRLVGLTFARQGRKTPANAAVVTRLFEAAIARGQAASLVARDDAGRDHAGLILVWDDITMYYLAGGGDPDLRQSGAMSMLLWEAIRLSRELNLKFDFEGSMVPAIEHYFRAFGAHQQTYFKLSGGTIRYQFMKAMLGLRKFR